MKKLLTMVAMPVIVVCLLAGCGAGAAAYTDTEKTININVSGEFVIALDSNPSTGYVWMESYDASMLKLVESKYERGRQANHDMVGAGGTYLYRFKALKPGKTEITLTYKRQWETDFAKQKVFNIEVK